MFSIITRFAGRADASDDGGQTLVEYTLILMFVALVTVTALEALGLKVVGFIDDATAGFGGA
jgi:Flp pilus assembly pilin Flp